MKPPVPLPLRLAPAIRDLPETGMGYLVANVRLKDGTEFHRVVIDSGYLVSVERKKEIPFDPEDIVAIEPTHDRSAVVR